MLTCPRCGGKNFWRLATGQRRCGQCGLTRKFDKTYWNSSKITPYWKGRLLECFCLGVPAYRLRHQVPLDLKTVQRWFRILRVAIYAHEMKEMKALLAGTGNGASLPGEGILFRSDFSTANGQLALGIYKGNGRVFALPISFAGGEADAKAGGEAGHLHVCDETLACTLLDIRGNSVSVNGEKGTRKGREVSWDIEGFWTFTRQWLRHYRGVPRAYFPLYLKEIEWRFNHRGENLVKLARHLLDQRVSADSEALRPEARGAANRREKEPRNVHEHRG
jgi:transposase